MKMKQQDNPKAGMNGKKMMMSMDIAEEKASKERRGTAT